MNTKSSKDASLWGYHPTDEQKHWFVPLFQGVMKDNPCPKALRGKAAQSYQYFFNLTKPQP